MNFCRNMRKIINRVALSTFFLGNLNKERFECPICCYNGPFVDLNLPTGFRKHAKCPKCSCLERHRIQYLVAKKVLNGIDTSTLKMLHFAPEIFFIEFFSKQFSQYETADLSMNDVDHKVDLQELPFEDQTYDFVFASHVLEHIPNDKKAISEIRRILKPNGITILPVPIVADRTIEYPEPNQAESNHVRAPGFDYFDRYSRYFSKIEKYSSDSFPNIYQLHVYEKRNLWPTKQCPLLLPVEGYKHVDIVPVCYV